MKGFSSIVSRNMKVIIRSKLSFALVVLAPILIVFLVGSAFNTTQLSNIKIGVYSENYSSLSNEIISDLEENKFRLDRIGGLEECVSLVKTGKAHSCVVFPSDMEVSGNEESISIYVDNSRINLAYSLLNKIESRVSMKSSELGIAIADDLIEILNEIKTSLPSQKSDLNSVKDKLEDIESSSGSSSSLSSSISKIERALDLLDGIETESSLSSIESELNAVKENLISSQSNIENINQDTGDSITKVNYINSELNSIISKLEKISVKNAESVVMPIQTEVKPISDVESNWEYLFPTLVSLVALLSGMVLSSSVVLTERRARANFRNFMTPTGNLAFVLAAYVTCMIILVIQMVVLILGTIYLTEVNVLPVIDRASFILFLASSVFVLLGMLIGYLFKSDETTTLASISVASLLIFFSNAIIPSESMGGLFGCVAKYNPLIITESLMKRVVLFGENWSSLWIDMSILAGAGIIILLFVLFARVMTRRKI